MSAIAGVFFFDGRPVERDDLERMNDSMAHRGRDGLAVWSSGAIGLANRQSWTTLESRGERLPLVDPSTGLAIAADARIDNREELARALDLSCDESTTDSRLILDAYGKWGDRCPERLLGDFAFVVWDPRKQALFCARDHMGTRQLSYHHRPGRFFVFGSEVKALLCLEEIPRRLNEVRVGDYILPILEDKEITFYRDILRLPPAHSLTVNRDGLTMRRYWSFDPEKEIRLKSDAEYAEAYREVFFEAVRCRLRGGVAVGSLLSGGLDSSSIACAARDILKEGEGRRLHTFSAVFDRLRECDETEYIQSVIDQGHIEPHFVQADRVGPLLDVERLHQILDEPINAPNMFIHWRLYNEAQTHGVRILLDGLDGDTTVSHGVQRVCELFRSGRWWTMAREAKGLARSFNTRPLGVLWRRAVKPLVPETVRNLKRMAQGTAGSLRTPNETLRPEFVQRIHLVERERQQLAPLAKAGLSVRRDHYRRLTTGLIPLVLELAERAAATVGIDPRYPFFDRRLMEFCLAAPSAQKVRNGYTRYIMRQGMTGVLPEKIRMRPGKSDLSANFRQGLLRYGEPLLDDVILKNPSELEPFIDIDALRGVYARYKETQSNEDSLAVWRPVTLSLWLRQAKIEIPS